MYDLEMFVTSGKSAVMNGRCAGVFLTLNRKTVSPTRFMGHNRRQLFIDEMRIEGLAALSRIYLKENFKVGEEKILEDAAQNE